MTARLVGARGAARWPGATDPGNITAWTPASQSKITAWLRLQDATVTSGEYSSVPDKIQTNPAVANSARRPAQGLAASSVPIATFATNDCLSWPIGTGNNGLDQKGFAFWMRPASLPAFATLVSIWNGTSGASARQMQLVTSFGLVALNVIASGNNGRQGASGSVLTAGTWVWMRMMYDSSQSTEATKAKVYINGALQTLTFSNVGAGGTIGTLPSVSGNILIGNQNDGTASSPFLGDFGPNFYCLNADLTAAEEAQLMQFEAPNP